MSIPAELHIHFKHGGIDYDLDLIKSEQTGASIKINGMSYTILGPEDKLTAACKILASASLDSVANFEDLQKKLSLLDSIASPADQKTAAIGSQALTIKQGFRVWRKDEEENLQKTKAIIAKHFGSHRAALSLEKLTPLSVDELWAVRNRENCHPLGYVKDKPYEITQEDLAHLKEYLDDIGFSGVVSLSDFKRTYTVTPTKHDAYETAPLCIHSIAKVLTGVLALLTMPATAFAEGLQLSPDVLAYLKNEKEEIYRHLQNPNLLQAMNHNGGFSDYLQNYEKALASALKNGEAPPEINSPEDFLRYAENRVDPLDSGIYSNLGILLVGLALQHACGDKPFDRLLEETILAPAGVHMSKIKPEGAKFNDKDPCQGMIVGGPSGGYWSTAKDLAKLGVWLQSLCQKPDFLLKLKLYGREFYDPDDKEIRHNGCSSSGSSFLSSFLQSGVTIAVLSDQGDFMANRIYFKIREKLIEQ